PSSGADELFSGPAPRSPVPARPVTSSLGPVGAPRGGAVPEVGRNDPCPCGSGKKYKKCHGANR
ncbi:MAG: SEC-C metal-binding domain-containing protein, partial [Gemmatimonadales bacterium]